MSLRLRLTLLSLVALVLGLLAGGIAVPILVERFLTDRVDDQLREIAGPAIRAVSDPDYHFGPRPGGPGRTNPTRVYVAMADTASGDSTGTFLDGSDLANAPRLKDLLDHEPYQIFTVPGEDSGRYRALVALGPPGTDQAFAVALPLTEVDATVRQVVTFEVVTIALAVLGVAALAWWLIGLGLRPLRRMEANAQSIAEAGEPGEGQRIEHPPASTELGRLGVTLNTMLDRIDESFAARRASEDRLRRFAADASHELRTPLTSIRGYAELYRRGGDRPDQVARSMSRIEAEASRMGILVEDLLTLTRLDEGRPLERQPVDLAELAAKAVSDARVVEPARPITLEAPAPVVVEGDADRLMQVLVNLLSNAIRHTPADTAITVRARAEEATAVLEVADRGPGLTEEQATQVFDRFYRADPSRSRAQGGSGLGLAIVEAVVRAHGGRAAVDATPGGGATFRIALPLPAVTAGQAADVPSSRPDGAA